jgi:hypothetical protein
MPQFGHQNGFDTVSIITGPAHVLLGIRFSDSPTELPFVLSMRPAKRTCCGLAPLDADQIREAIVAGVAKAATEGNRPCFIAEAFYIESDSPKYGLYRHAAELLALRRNHA